MNPENVAILFEDVHDFFSKKSGRNSIASTLLSIKIAQTPDTKEVRDMVVAATKFAINQAPESELFFCSEDMTDVVEHGAKLLDSTDKIDSSLLPAPVGFCYFPRGVSLGKADVLEEDSSTTTLESYITHALYWAKLSDETYILVSLNDSFAEQDTMSKSLRNQFLENNVYFDAQQRWTPNYVAFARTGGKVANSADEKITSEEIAKKNLRLLELSPQALAQSLFLMLNQHIFVDSSERIKTNHKKRLKRLNLKNLPTSVQVIKLRKVYRSSKNSSLSEEKIEYSHRWFVTGHWRWQPYKNKETEKTEYKRIWIHPHIKGPDDKPLKTTPKVFALVR